MSQQNESFLITFIKKKLTTLFLTGTISVPNKELKFRFKWKSLSFLFPIVLV